MSALAEKCVLAIPGASREWLWRESCRESLFRILRVSAVAISDNFLQIFGPQIAPVPRLSCAQLFSIHDLKQKQLEHSDFFVCPRAWLARSGEKISKGDVDSNLLFIYAAQIQEKLDSRRHRFVRRLNFSHLLLPPATLHR